ncbi:MAG: sigma-70 family RNA polymerase sigma factor [bacterium]|nr:sigma-70 family RNA polymerase sigma factor [bacterium]
MNPRVDDAGAEWLLQHVSWIRELARSLVGDTLRAEDLVQDTLVAALEHPPSTDRPLRPWLGTVLRNFARKTARRRSASPVQGSELEQEDTSELAGPGELSEQLESERLMTEELARLDEPFRQVVLMRYYHALPPKEIARRLGVPGGTVRWRLKRGLELLRERLDQRCGNRRMWCLLLFPLARPKSATVAAAAGSSAAFTGVVAMSVAQKTGAAVAAVVVALLGLAVTGILPDPLNPFARMEAPLEVVFRPLVPETVAQEERSIAPETATSDRHSIEAVSPGVASTELDASRPLAIVEAVITDLAGNALAGASLREVTLSGPGPGATSGAGGVVRLELEAGDAGRGVHLESGLAGFTSSTQTVRIAPGETTHIGRLELAPGGGVSGRVVDRDGLGVAGVLVTAGEAQTDRSSLERSRFGPQRISVPACRSDAQGDFFLRGLADGFVRIWGRGEGRLPSWTAPVEVRDGQESCGVELVLPLVGDANRIRGVVLDPDGEPVPRAWLEYYHRSERGGLGMGDGEPARADGTFEFVVFDDAVLSITAEDPEGRYGSATAQRYGPAAAEGIRAGEQALVLRLVEGERVMLHVYAADGEVVEQFGLEVLPVEEEDLPSDLSPKPTSGPDAGYLVPNAPYYVRITAPLHAVETLGPLRPEDERRSLEVHLTATPGLQGRAFAGGEALAGARATLHRVVPSREHYERSGFRCWQEVQELDAASSDGAGRFVLTPRAAGEYVVRVEKEGLAAAEFGPFQLGAELLAEPFEVHLGQGGTIEGRVYAPLGEDPTGTIVAAHRGDGRPRTVRVGPDGSFRFAGLMPGSWRVEDREQESARVSTTRRQYASRSFEAEVKWNCEVHEGATTRFDLRSRDAQAYRVQGRLTLDGELHERWVAWLSPIDTPFFDNTSQAPTSLLDPEGHFELSAAEAGEYWVCVKRVGEGIENAFARKLHLNESEMEVALEFETGTLVVEDYDVVPLIEGDDVPSLIYLWSDESGALFASLLMPDEAGTCTLAKVPAGQGRLARPNLERLLDPMGWEVVLPVEIRPGEVTRVRAP